jgi:hypothetical protein
MGEWPKINRGYRREWMEKEGKKEGREEGGY